MFLLKCRTECPYDIRKLKTYFRCKRVYIKTWSIIDIGFGEREWLFDTRTDLLKIIRLMNEVENCHVAAQTVRHLADYTGERDYDL